MYFSVFATHLHQIEQHSKRLEITAVLRDLFRQLDAAEMEQATYLLQGGLTPNYISLEFQMSEKLLLRALAQLAPLGAATQASAPSLFAETDLAQQQQAAVTTLQKRYKQLGDIGQLFWEVLGERGQTTDNQLTIATVYERLRQLALASGVGSQERKLDLLADLLIQLDPLSGKYISRIILGKLRLGFSTMTILDALSFAKTDSKQDSKLLELAFQKKADLGKLAKSYLLDFADRSSEEFLASYQVEWGVPVLPALCQRLNSAQEIIDKMGTVVAEAKYDGLRVQLHIKSGACRAFTRNLEDVTHMFPELAQLPGLIKARNCILDSEAIGINPATGAFLPFQDTIQRKRKHDVAAKAAEVPLRFYVFDILLLDDQSLIEQPFTVRRQQLERVVEDGELIQKTAYELISEPSKLRLFHEAQLAAGLEGAVMKQPDSIYMSGRKGWRWVKIKEEEGSQGKLSDTIDCVLLGYYLGKGKRQVFGIGALLVGVLDRDDEGQPQVKTLSKIGTGLTDEQFREVKALADQHRVEQPPAVYAVDKHLHPDVWLAPQLVLEIAADEISQSPIHSAGVALRFPRLVRIRHDKAWQDATTLTELGEIKIA